MRLPRVIRNLRARPGFSLLIVVLSALVVGITTSVFRAVDGILFRPPAGIEQPAQVFRLYQAFAPPSTAETVSRTASYPQYKALVARLGPVADLAAVYQTEVSEGLGASARLVNTGFVTSGFFEVLGVRMLLGRNFGPDEDSPPAGENVAIVSERYWREALQGQSGVLGQPLVIAGQRFSIIGVLAQPFSGLGGPPVDVWLPLSTGGAMFRGVAWDFSYGDRWIQIIGRYRSSATESAIAAVATQALNSATGAGTGAAVRALVGPIQLAWGPGPSLQARVSTWLLAMTLAVLLIGCANIANLYVVRAAARRRELALRMALGASGWLLLRQLLAETILLSALGGILGIAIASFATEALGVLLQVPNASTQSFNLRVLAVSLMAAGLVAAVSAVLPLIGVTRTDIAATIREGGSQATQRKSRMRGVLAAVQVGLAALLLVGAGLFTHTVREVFSIDLGLDPERVLVARVDLSVVGRSPEQSDEYFRRAQERLQRLPMIESASIGSSVPFSSGEAVYLAVPGQEPLLDQGGEIPWVNLATSDLFRTLGMRVVEGRGLTSADRRGSERVAVVSRAMAKALWPGDDAVGQCLTVGTQEAACTRVVGVIADAARDRPTKAASLQYFLPFDQANALVKNRALFLRTSVAPELAIADVRREMQALAADLPYPSIVPLQQLIEPYVRPWRTGATLLTVFAGIAILLAIFGLQTVIAYAIVERRRELAVRLALGGTPGSVLLLVTRQGLRLGLAGTTIGLLVAAVAAPRITPMLFQTSALEPSVYVVVGVVLVFCSALAAWLPALRAASIPPAEVLRSS